MTTPDSFDRQTLLLIDAHALIYRAYFAFPELTTPEGILANAVFGFTKAVLTAIRDYEPRYLAVAFDHPQPTHRHLQYDQYKAHREKMPDDLIPQIAMIKQVVEVLRFPKFEVAGWEADDLIGTLAAQVADPEVMSVIVTGDKDTFQLVTDRVHVWLPARGKDGRPTEYDAAGVAAKMGVRPDQVVDLKALMGDASDNIPGVSGVGPKTAAQLLHDFETLDGVYQAVAAGSDRIKPALLKKLQTDQELAFLSRDLATIQTNAPIQLDLDACRISGYDRVQATELFEELGFKSLLELLPADDFELSLQQALF